MPHTLVAMIIAATAITSATLTEAVRRMSLRFGWVDTPTHRGLHDVPTPRLGGVAMAAAVVIGLGGAAASGLNPSPDIWLIAGALGCGAVGLIDDVTQLSPVSKLAGQTICALAIAPIVSDVAALPPWFVKSVCVFVIVTYVNQFNFMDGSDGLAAAIAVVHAVVFAGFARTIGHPDLMLLALAIAAIALGFLWKNLPPAVIFMGDSGSHLLGYLLAAAGCALVLRGLRWEAVLVALTPMLFDTSFTLARRVLNRQPFWRAHREHLYQRLILGGWTKVSTLVLYVAWAIISGLFGLAIVSADSTATSLLLVVTALAGGACVTWLVHATERRLDLP